MEALPCSASTTRAANKSGANPGWLQGEHTCGRGVAHWAELSVTGWSGRFSEGAILPGSGEPWVINGIKDKGAHVHVPPQPAPPPLPRALPLTLALRLGLRALGRSSGECDCVAWHTCISRGRVKGARWYVEQTVEISNALPQRWVWG